MKKIWFLFIFVALIGFLASCDEETILAPMNVRIENETILIWDEVIGAQSYIVAAGAEQVQDIQTTQLDLSVFYDVLSDGTYEVSVAATIEDYVSDFSESITFVIDTSVSSVTNLTLSESMLNWDEVSEATSYRITVLGETFSVTQNAFDLSQVSDMPLEVIDISVTAIEGTKSSTPVTISYDYTTGGLEPTAFMLKMIDASYDLDLEESDFDSQEDYDMYIMNKEMVEMYMQYSSDEPLQNTAMMFKMAQSLNSVSMSMDPMSIYDLFDNIESMDGMSVATLLLNYVVASLEMQESYNEMYLESIQDHLINVQQAYQDVINNGIIKELYDLLSPYVSDSDFDALFTDLNMEYYDIDAHLNILNETIYALENGYMLYPYEDANFALIQNIVVDAYNADPEAITSFVNDNNTYSAFMDYVHTFNMYQSFLFELDMQNNDDNEMLLTLIEDDREALETALAVFIDYIFDVRDAIETPLNNLEQIMNSGSVTNLQIVNLKDQVIYAIYENLPEQALLDDAFEAIMVILYAQGGLDIDDVASDAEILSSQFLLSMEIFAEIMYMIDEADVEFLLSSVDNIMTSGSFDVVIDVLVWGADHILTFNESFPELTNSLQSSELSVFDVSIFNASLSMYVDVDVVTMLLSSLTSIQEPLLNDYMEIFVETNGALFKDINALINLGLSLDDVIEGLVPYTYATTTNLMTEDVDVLITDILTLLAPEIALYLGLEETDVETLVGNVSDDINVFIDSFLVIGQVLVESAAMQPFDDALASDEALFLTVLDTLSEMFSKTDFIDVYNNALNALENILLDPQVLAITLMTESDVEAVINEAKMMVQSIITDIIDAAGIDPNNITLEEEETLANLYHLFLSLFSLSSEPPIQSNIAVYADNLDEAFFIDLHGPETFIADIYVYDDNFEIIDMYERYPLYPSDSPYVFSLSQVSEYYYIEIELYDTIGNYVDFYVLDVDLSQA